MRSSIADNKEYHKKMAQQAATRVPRTRGLSAHLQGQPPQLLRSVTKKDGQTVTLRMALEEGPTCDGPAGQTHRAGFLSKFRRAVRPQAYTSGRTSGEPDIVNVSPSRDIYILARQSMEATFEVHVRETGTSEE